MRIRSVDFPEELLNAQANGSLVIFAGAGVSMGGPSKLPNFKTLADEIAQNVINRTPGEPEDRFLGRVANRGTNVHERAREILDNPTSRPTRIHNAIVSLFRDTRNLRIVTTNFDRHFSTVLANNKLHGETNLYTGPALPLGDDFHGLVYLHGSVNDPSSLILTDSDFGRAYLTVGWATQFLRRLFNQYTVLFIGYSHRDVVMDYLARGLPPGTSRFALVEEGMDLEEWQFKGITPVLFPIATGEDRYSELESAMVAWGERTQLSVLDHETRIKQLVSQPTLPINPEDIDYLQAAIKNDVHVRFFTRYAKNLHCLQWIENEPTFKRLFDPNVYLTYPERELAEWFACNFSCHYLYESLGTVERNGTKLNQFTWSCVASYLWRANPKPNLETIDKWIAVLLASPQHTWDGQLASYLLENVEPMNPSTILLFAELTKPQLKLNPYIALTPKEKAAIRVDISLTGEDYWLRKVWVEKLKPSLNVLSPKLEPILLGHIVSAQNSLRVLEGGNEEWDPISWGRSAIEPHQQNNTFPDGIDFLIDALRDVTEVRLQGRNYVMSKVSELSALEFPILKRLAIHLMIETTVVTPNVKIRWILRSGWLYSGSLKHEVYRLLHINYPLCSTSIRNALIRTIMKGPKMYVDSDDDEFQRLLFQYEIFNILSWLQQAAPEDQQIINVLNELREKNPEFQVREHPDMNHWHGPIQLGHMGQSFSVDDILNMDPENVVLQLCNVSDSRSDPWVGSNILEEFIKAITVSFDKTLLVIKTLPTGTEKVSSDVWRAIFVGWRQAKLKHQQWKQVLGFLAVSPVTHNLDLIRDISHLIQQGLNPNDALIPDEALESVKALLDHLWSEIEQQGTVEQTSDINAGDTTLLDKSGGQITLCWLYILSRERKNWAATWDGLPRTYKKVLGQILESPGCAGRAGTAMIAANISFLFELDSDWSVRYVIPLFKWNGEIPHGKVIDAWTGYLVTGRIHPDLVDSFADDYVKATTMMSELQDLRERLCVHIAWIALYGEMNTDKTDWLIQCLNNMSDSERTSWARHLRWEFQHTEARFIEKAWLSWLERYWSSRILGIPTPLSTEEIVAMIGWMPCLTPVFPQVVGKVLQTPCPPPLNGWIFHELRKSKEILEWPNDVAQLLIYLLRGMAQPLVAYMDDIKDLVNQLLGYVSEQDLLKICNELARLGYPETGDLQGEIMRHYH